MKTFREGNAYPMFRLGTIFRHGSPYPMEVQSLSTTAKRNEK